MLDFLKKIGGLFREPIRLCVYFVTTKWLIPRAKRYVIHNRGDDSQYLVRYILFSSKWFTVYIHRFMDSDSDSSPHDHPWNFFTYIVTKGYWEHRFLPKPGDPKGTLQEVIGYRRPGSIAYRRAEDLHHVQLAPPALNSLESSQPGDARRFVNNNITSEEDAPLTICFILKRRRIWGFAQPTPTGYIWRNYMDFLEIEEPKAKYKTQ